MLPIDRIERVRLTRNVLHGSVHTGKPQPPLDMSWRDLREEREGVGAILWPLCIACAVAIGSALVPIIRHVWPG